MTGEAAYVYSAQPRRNPFRVLLALWRSFRDLSDTDEVAIVEIAFARSRMARRFARWGQVIALLESDPKTAPMLAQPRRFGPIDLAALSAMPEGSLGRALAHHCTSGDLDPNLVRVDGDRPDDELLDRLYGTHDVWHVATGWGNDDTGEVGLGGFYVAQLEAPFFVFVLAIIFLNTVFMAPTTLRPRLDAFVAGYRAGRSAEPLFGVDWDSEWETPLAELRVRLGLTDSEIVGDGIRVAP